MADRQRHRAPADGGRYGGAALRSESAVPAGTDSAPLSARSSLHPGGGRGGDDSYLPFDDGVGYDPSQALSRAPNENFKVMS